MIAPLWVAYTANLGTLARTCDAVGACMAVRDTPHYRQALARGDTLPRRPHIHWVGRSPLSWLERERAGGAAIVAVELAEDATPLTRLAPARRKTVVVLGHEHEGVPRKRGRCSTRSSRSRWSAAALASTWQWRARSCCTGWRGSHESDMYLQSDRVARVISGR